MAPSSRLLLLMVSILSLFGGSGLGQNLDFLDNLPPGLSLSAIGNLKPGKINDEVDSLLETIGSSLPSKVDLGTIDRRFAYNCILTGLDKGIYREGDAHLSTDTAAIFTFGLSTNRLTVQCNWRKRILILSFGGAVRAHTNKVSIRANITLEIAPGAEPKLEEFRVTYMDRIYTDVSGAGLLDFIGEKILDKLANGAKAQIIREVEQNLSRRLQEILGAFKLPSL